MATWLDSYIVKEKKKVSLGEKTLCVHEFMFMDVYVDFSGKFQIQIGLSLEAFFFLLIFQRTNAARCCLKLLISWQTLFVVVGVRFLIHSIPMPAPDTYILAC